MARYRHELTKLHDYLRFRGIQVRHLKAKDADHIRHKWNSIFLSHSFIKEAEINSNYLVWHAYSSGKIPCLEKQKAHFQFAKRYKSIQSLHFCVRALGIFIVDSMSEPFVPTIANELHEVSGLFADSIWTGGDYEWSYLTTHEAEWGVGPYFVLAGSSSSSRSLRSIDGDGDTRATS
ncbi:DUF4275 family protein [bacterium]|nr:DUF4275 family protein [bacterium]